MSYDITLLFRPISTYFDLFRHMMSRNVSKSNFATNGAPYVCGPVKVRASKMPKWLIRQHNKMLKWIKTWLGEEDRTTKAHLHTKLTCTVSWLAYLRLCWLNYNHVNRGSPNCNPLQTHNVFYSNSKPRKDCWQANILFLDKSIMLQFYFMGPLTHLCEPLLSKICSHITSSQLLISELFKSILNVFGLETPLYHT